MLSVDHIVYFKGFVVNDKRKKYLPSILLFHFFSLTFCYKNVLKGRMLC